MPRNGLTLTIGVSRHVNRFRLQRRATELGDDLLFARDNLVVGCKIMLDVDRVTTFGEITNMTHRCQHFVPFSKILFDGTRLGWGFHNDQFIWHQHVLKNNRQKKNGAEATRMFTIYGVCDVLVKHQPAKRDKTNVLEYKSVGTRNRCRYGL